ncbi:phosphoglycerate mutase-like protein AT74 [Macadamia integrifolia]|uniref:phosphoglycerate mutase-like protein AT74 n=1 Tax=Macadamia integrifolia TaxID=60698 RepID=UPI001C52DB17|nr:phosphoglycerate mutase-like protein AT74 [Macadamia integrifolia]
MGHRILPKRIILVRHGESQGNQNDTAYATTPDSQIPLTTLGIKQAQLAGEHIRRVVSDEGLSHNWKVYFYVSPYQRTRSTLREIGRSFTRDRILGVREECRIREQDFGNFQEKEQMKANKADRQRFSRFFFRFPQGESAADVFDRISSFLESLWRDIEMKRLVQHQICDDEINLIIVSHGLALRVFLMKWFKWTAEQFELLYNLDNCECRVIQLGAGGKYSLAIHHSEKELVKWGFSPEMIADQKWRANADKGNRNDKCLDAFFDHLPGNSSSSDSSDSSDSESYSDDNSILTCDQDGEIEIKTLADADCR